MTQALMDYTSAVAAAEDAALELMLAERRLPDASFSAVALAVAEQDLYAAAVTLTAAVDDLPALHSRRPVGWDERKGRLGRLEDARDAVLAVVAARLHAAYSSGDKEAAGQFGEERLALACRDLTGTLEAQRAARAEEAGRLL